MLLSFKNSNFFVILYQKAHFIFLKSLFDLCVALRNHCRLLVDLAPEQAERNAIFYIGEFETVKNIKTYKFPSMIN